MDLNQEELQIELDYFIKGSCLKSDLIPIREKQGFKHFATTTSYVIFIKERRRRSILLKHLITSDYNSIMEYYELHLNNFPEAEVMTFVNKYFIRNENNILEWLRQDYKILFSLKSHRPNQYYYCFNVSPITRRY